MYVAADESASPAVVEEPSVVDAYVSISCPSSGKARITVVENWRHFKRAPGTTCDTWDATRNAAIDAIRLVGAFALTAR
jgi:hypothetical protein